MNFHILTLFPEMVMDGLNTSIIGRAVNAGYLSIEAVNIRDYAFNKHQSVDDYPYGGGAGMLMQAEPVYLAYKAVEEKIARPRAEQIRRHRARKQSLRHHRRKKGRQRQAGVRELFTCRPRARCLLRRWRKSWRRRKI